MQRKY